VSGSDLKQRLAAILAADVAGYSRLMAADERATVAALDAARAVFRRQIESSQGRVIDMAGDSVLAVFETATGAVGAALAIQKEVNSFARELAEERCMRFRIGIHLGDVIEKADGTIYGDGVNIAARLEGLAEPGGITVSDSVRNAVKGRIGASFEDQGDQQVKNIAEPVRAYRVSLAGDAASKPRAAVGEIDLSLPDKPSIAVLPFVNMSGDPEQEYFTDGVTEDIITELSRFHSLFVVARNSSFTYKGKSPDIRQVGKELGVRYVLEGSIRRSANRIRVTGQLIDTLSGNHIWAEKYDRVLEDVFEVQEEVTRAIVTAIAPQIESVELAKARRRRPENLSAYEIAMRAWAHAMDAGSEGDRASANLAIQEARQALAIDPSSVLALMAHAWSHACLLFFQLAPDLAHALREAAWAAARAVELDRSDATALAFKAMIPLLGAKTDQYPEALADARRAHDINPNDTFALLMLVHLEAFGTEPHQAIEHGLRILRLNPGDSRLHLVYNAMCGAAFAAKRYEDGVRWGLRAIHDMPRMPQPYGNVALCYLGLGEIEKGKAAFDKLREIAPVYVESRVRGHTIWVDPEVRKRALTFYRVAAGLEDPSAAQALR